MRFLTAYIFVAVSFAAMARADDSTTAAFEKEVRPVLKTLCYGCHGPGKQKGGIRFDQLNPDLVNGNDAETWHDVLDQLNLGEMPPKKSQQPTAIERRLLSDWLQSALREAASAKRYKNGRVVMRRLTRYEYANSMRDLLGIEMDFAQDLPPEPPSREGFLNNGATLEMSPTQIEAYLAAARRALNEAIVTGDRPQLHLFQQEKTAVGRLPLRKVAGHVPVKPEFILDLKTFPRQGPFELKVTARAAIPAGHGLPRMKISMGHVPGIIHVPRGEIGEADVSEKSQTFVFRGRMEDFPQPGPIAFGNSGFKGIIVMVDFLDADGQELRYPDRQYAIDAKPKKTKSKAKPNAKQQTTSAKKTIPFGKRLEIEITSIEFRAPVYASWPPASHRRLLFENSPANKEPQYVRELLRQFMTSAFRRPPQEEEIERTAKLFEVIRPRTDSFEEAMRETFASVLVSPHFLYIVENREPQTQPQRVTEFELASRLSYFLWSSAPDQALFEAARTGKLNQTKNLRGQVERMLANERSAEFARRFVDQWLDMDALDRVAVNPEFFPGFDNSLKRHMREETRAYFAEILVKDRSALELLESDWAMLNRPLAKHYGLNGPRSSQFERVVLKQTDNGKQVGRRGGLLGQGAFLLAGGNGEDSHPIKRAVWILDRLLDSPPASPPPDVPELNPERADLANLTLKEQLAVHRKKESCANCHAGIDPWGVPLEHFDAVGRWRDEIPKHKQRPAVKVDAASTLPDGAKIDGAQTLQQYLVKHRQPWFARSLVKRVMAYGLGRSLDFGDREAIETLTKRFVESDYSLKSLIVDFVQSETFRTK